jgi:tRNA(Ile)-lysidine synthase
MTELMTKEEQKFLKFITDYDLINREDKILVALSGGPDSVLLLHLLKKFQKKFQLEMAAFHLNHKIRGKEADKDEAFCKKLCDSLDVELFSASEDVPSFARHKKFSKEEAGRILRYDYLTRIASENGFNKIATAHNCDDNAETILLNVIKGTGLNGLTGIPIKRGNIIRPMLALSKNEILNYLKRNKIKFRVDKTNLQNENERSFLRNKIIPLIKKKLNPSFDQNIFTLGLILKDFQAYIGNKITEAILSTVKNEGDTSVLNVDSLKQIEKEILGEALKRILEMETEITVGYDDVSKLILLIDKDAGKKVNLSGNYTAIRERNEIRLSKAKKSARFVSKKINPGETINIDDKTIYISTSINPPEKYSGNRFVEYIDADKIATPFLIRRWKAGDKFIPLGSIGTKKISDFLNEQKVPVHIKKEQLLLTCSSLNRTQVSSKRTLGKEEIIWVIGFRIDDRFKVTTKSRKALQLCLKQ